jgi:dephospho-CoA kinase
MIVLGLTGSIGMGKSTAASMLEKMGLAVHNSDDAVHGLLSPKGAAFEIVAVSFPEAWDKKTHTIRRDILGKMVFENVEKRKELESILHPLVQKSQIDFIKKQHALGRAGVVLDIPLLFETGADARVDYTLVVTAPDFIQRQRVLGRPNMNEEKFERIRAAQMPDGEKCARADFVVQTGLGYGYTYRALKKIVKQICP